MRLWLPTLLLTACGPGEGTVAVTAWGEERAYNGFTAEQTDGWTITFDHWYTVIEDITLSDPQRGDALATAAGPFLVDWAALEDPEPVTTLTARAGRADVGFAFDVAGQRADGVGDVTADELAPLEAGGFVHLVQGSATDGERTLTFSWGLDTAVSYELCRNGLDDTPGLAIVEGETVGLQLTMHTDHLFWDEMGTEEAALTFGALAEADANGDGDISLAELEQRSTLEAGYETGGFDLPDLATYLSFAAAQAGHVNGGGLCQARAR